MSSAPVLSGAGTLLFLDGVSATDTAGSYGAWVEMSDALPYDTNAITLSFAGSAGRGLFRLGIGAAASEVVIANDIPFYVINELNGASGSITLPLALPKGARLAIGVTTDATAYATLTPAHPWSPIGYRYAVGINSWTQVTGGSSGAYGSSINHTTSLAAGFKALMLAVADMPGYTDPRVVAELAYDGQAIGNLLYSTIGLTVGESTYTFSGPASYVVVHGSFSAGKTVSSRHQADNTSDAVVAYHALIGLG